MIPVITPEEARAADAASDQPLDMLIERAGTAVAVVAVRLLGGTYGRRITVICGPGNNGADGRVAARRLASRGAKVDIVDAATCPVELPDCDLVIDAAFGTGFRGQWTAPEVGSARVLAVDVPTGVDASTGRADGPVLPADVTVTFAAAKPGHLLGDGRSLCGTLEVVDIGLDVSAARIGIIEASDIAHWWCGRRADDHKWDHAVRVVAGSVGMTGAASLVASAAQRVGAGIVHLTVPGVDQIIEPAEAVRRRVDPSRWADDVLDDLDRFDSLALGPGLGRADGLSATMATVVAHSPIPVVVDGDGLTALAGSTGGVVAALGPRSVPTVLTPHDGEFAALVGGPVPEDRLGAVRSLAAETGAVVLLKGPVTLIAAPDGEVRVVANGTPVLATAGSGDVLTGLIAGLMAGLFDESVALLDTVAAAAWIHAATAESVAPVGAVARDLVDAVPSVLATVIGSGVGR